MKKTTLLLLLAGLFGMSGMAQDCATDFAIWSQQAKIKDYDASYAGFQKTRKECPSYSLATYQLGERILKHRIKNAANDAAKMAEVKDLMALNEERLKLYPSKTKKTDVMVDNAQMMFDNGIGTQKEQYEMFDKAFKADSKEFTSPKGLYTYFSLLVDMSDAGQYPISAVFAKYDDVMNQIGNVEDDYASKIAAYEAKEEAGSISAKDKKKLGAYERNLEIVGKIKGSINSKLGSRADCTNLVPLYRGEFDSNRNNTEWLNLVAGRLAGKECTDDPLFFEIVQELHRLSPSADSAYYLSILSDKKGDSAGAAKYLNESISLQTDPKKKAKAIYSQGQQAQKAGRYGEARRKYNEVLAIQPSYGRAYLSISQMIAASANNCGSTPFEKRAVYWLAARYADKAARVDGSIAGTARKTSAAYNAKAPSKSDIFSQGMSGKTIRIGCWIGESVAVPNL